uniref:Hexosyltransferase n=1 Tax=Suricata suricatta TaxID=37032 RepID=A0A673TSW8_SURSU
MGGPGMIFSREVLRRMVPHIGECLREMYTTHEDVEVGRCVRRFGGTQCVWSYEMCLLLFCLQIAGTCHETEQEIILRCSLTSFAEPKATREAAPQTLGSLTRLLGKTFRGVYVTLNIHLIEREAVKILCAPVRARVFFSCLLWVLPGVGPLCSIISC